MIERLAGGIPIAHQVYNAGPLVSFLVGFILGMLVLAYFQNSNKI